MNGGDFIWLAFVEEIKARAQFNIIDNFDLITLFGRDRCKFHKELINKIIRELVKRGYIKQISRGRAGIKYHIER